MKEKELNANDVFELLKWIAEMRASIEVTLGALEENNTIKAYNEVCRMNDILGWPKNFEEIYKAYCESQVPIS